MNHLASIIAILGALPLAAWGGAALAGFALGWQHWRLLRWNSRLYLSGASVGPALALHAARCAASGAALYLAARAGLALAPLLLGVLAARQLALRDKP